MFLSRVQVQIHEPEVNSCRRSRKAKRDVAKPKRLWYNALHMQTALRSREGEAHEAIVQTKIFFLV